MPLGPLLRRFGDNTDALAKAAGVSQRTVQRWCREGLPYIKADRVCCKVNEIPPHVWLDWDLNDAEIAAAAAFVIRLLVVQLS
jgi:hypothetical protein